MTAPAETVAYVGSFAMPDGPEGDGLHVLAVDADTGALRHVQSVAPHLNVGSAVVDRRRGVLYCTDELRSNAEYRARTGASGGGGGRVFAFAIHPTTGALTELGHVPSHGTQPAGIALDASGDHLVVTHFTNDTPITTIGGDRESGWTIDVRHDDATTVLFPLSDTGRIGDPVDVRVHPSDPSGPSCLHSVTASPDGGFFVVCDMSKDRVSTIRVDAVSDTVVDVETHVARPGSGPRYAAFHPSSPVVYVNHEHEPYIETFAYRTDGTLTSIGTVAVLPDDTAHRADGLTSDLRVHPSGRWVYTLVRGHDLVSVFAVGTDGTLTLVQTAELDGTGPKGCAVSHDGRHLYVAASRSDAVLVWSIDDDGTLRPTSDRIDVPRAGTITLHTLDER